MHRAQRPDEAGHARDMAQYAKGGCTHEGVKEPHVPGGSGCMPIPLHPHACARALAKGEHLLNSERLAAGVNVRTCAGGRGVRNFT